MSATQPVKHRWTFFSAGGLEQVSLEQGADIGALAHLDQKLWVALSSPARGLEFDTRTLELVDTDKDGRIRAPEIIAAAEWAFAQLKNPSELLSPAGALPLASINDQTASGTRILAGAKRILNNLGNGTAAAITVEEVADTSKIFAQTEFNGDGIVPATSSSDPVVQKIIEEIISTLAPVADRSGKPGIDAKKAETFFAEAQALADWHRTGQADEQILPLDTATADAFSTFQTVRPKVNDYFARCQLAAFDARAAGPLNRSESEFAALAGKELTVDAGEIAGLPLAHVSANASLPLDNAVNPAWIVAIEAFRNKCVIPFLGEKSEITQSEWELLKTKMARHESWLLSKPASAVEKLGIARLQEILATDAKQSITALIQEDLRLEDEHNSIAAVERLVRFYRDLNVLLRNFVNFADFYNPNNSAIFQTGTLYVDGRSCDLCVSVEDVAKHATLAAGGGIYLAYCEINRLATGQKRNICAAITTGSAETLWIGRNGIFYDRAGRDWDATIVKVVEHQISLREAFWSPWKKISRMISDQINKMLAAREAASLAAAGKTVDGAGATVAAGKPPAPVVPMTNSGAAMASSVAAIGIAVGLLGSAVGKLLEFVQDATLLNIILGVLCVIGAVSLPAVFIAYFKLRKRDMAPILNACGWAINRRIRLTLKLGRMLTKEATLPEGSKRKLNDPYAEDNNGRNFLILLILAITLGFLWYVGQFDPVLPGKVKSTTVFGTNAPAAPPPVVLTNSPPL